MSREMIDSNAGWIGSIPSEWSAYKLLYALERPIFDGPHETPTVVDNGIPFISVDSVNDTKNVDLNVCKKFISEEDFNEYYKKTPLKQGDVLFTKAATIGKTAIVDDRKYMVWSPLAILRSGKHVNNEYLYYVLNCPNLIDYTAHFLGNSATQINVGMRELERAKLPVPPLSEQRQIVHFLDRKCAAIDTAIEKTKKSIEKLEEYKKAVITKAVTKGIDPNAKMKDSGVEWIGEIPEGWEIIPNKHLMKKVKNLCPVYNGEDILSLSMKGVYVRDPNDESGKRPTTYNGYQYVQEGDLLMCLFDIDVTPRCVGRVYNDGLTSPAYSRFVMNKTRAIVDYYYYYYLALDFDKTLLHLSKNMRSSLTESDFGSINAPVPSPTEQQQIVHFLDRKCTAIDTAIEKKKKAIEKWEEYKKSLIYYAVTGKIDCRNEVI
jgi:type I restriction enzyme S subunit